MNKEKEMTGAEFIYSELSECKSYVELCEELAEYLGFAQFTIKFKTINSKQMVEDLFKAFLQVILDKGWVMEFVDFFTFVAKEDIKKERPRWNRA